MFQKILVPLDGSTRAESVLPLAAKVARQAHGEILLLRAIPNPLETGMYLVETSILNEEIIKENIAIVSNYLAHIAASEVLSGITTTVEIVNASAAEAILAAVSLQSADLVVMCSHDATVPARWALGSVSQRVLRHSHVPVLVLREGAGSPSNLHPEGLRPVRILVALDGSPLAETALEPAAYLSAALSAPMSGMLHLVQVLRLHEIEMHTPNVEFLQIKDQVIASAKNYLASVEQRLREGDLAKLGLTTSASVEIDRNVARALIDVAENGEEEKDTSGFTGYDIIALSTHGRSGITRWIMGSVTEDVINSTKIPLLIIRPEKVKKQEEKKEHAVETQTWVGLL